MDSMARLEKLDMGESMQDSELPKFLLMDEIKEFAPSAEIQAAEIRDVYLDMPELKFEVWKELSHDEKLAVLNTLEQRVSDIAMRTPMEVRTEEMKNNLMGYFDGKSLAISEKLMTDSSYEGYRQILDTLFHEGRHAYQDYNLHVQKVEQNNEMVESWRVNCDVLGYKSGNWVIFKELGYYEYYSQPVEVDARVFAETVLNAIGI